MEVEVQGHPEPIVKWYREGAEISSSPDYNLSRSNKVYRLTISEVFPEDAGHVKVIAANAEGSTATEALLQVQGKIYVVIGPIVTRSFYAISRYVVVTLSDYDFTDY